MSDTAKNMFLIWTPVKIGKRFLTQEIISDSRKVCKTLQTVTNHMFSDVNLYVCAIHGLTNNHQTLQNNCKSCYLNLVTQRALQSYHLSPYELALPTQSHWQYLHLEFSIYCPWNRLPSTLWGLWNILAMKCDKFLYNIVFNQ